MRKIFTILLVLQVFLVQTVVFAEETRVNPGTSEISLNAKLSDEVQPRQTTVKEADIQDPANYPLIGEEEFAGYLWDSYGGYQYVGLVNVSESEDYDDSMNVQLFYGSEYAYGKDSILNIEFYQEQNNTLNFLGETEFNTAGSTSGTLHSHVPKADFANSPYIYMRVGVRGSVYDSYYSDVVTFKAENPFYSVSNPGNGDTYAVISNESVNAESTQSTGTFNLKNMKYSMDKSLKPGAYKLDVDKPFDIAGNKGKLIQKNTKYINPSFNVGAYNYFWVTDITNDYNYQITARLAYKGSKANVWVHNDEISDADAAKLGQEFDGKIYSSVTSNFGPESDINQDKSINLLIFDIQDGFTGSGGFVGGYFYGGDLFNVDYSNQGEILYIDTYPSMGTGTTKDVTQAYETLAHEFQHMVNFNQTVLIEGSSTNMDTWLNEGLSMAAEQIYTGQGLSSRLDYYNVSSSIQNGHSLLYWGGDLLSNYSLSYLFGQYIKIQANRGDAIFKEILKDPYNDFRAVENIAKKYISPDMTFGKLMTNFRIALLLKEPAGLYGFKGDPFFDALEEKLYRGTSANLRGGGAISIAFNSEEGLTVPSNKGSDITYTTLNSDENPEEGATTPPVVNEVTDHETVVTGNAEPLSTLIAKVSGKEIGRSKAGEDRNFSITIPKQQAGVIIEVVSVDAAGKSSAPAKITVTKKLVSLIGSTRYATAAKVSEAGWKKSNSVLLVNGAAIVDGLTATPLAAAKDAPILLTQSGYLPTETLNEIKRLQAKEITIIGGTGVISVQVENVLKSQGYTIKRIGGSDRYGTSLLIAKELDKLVDVKTAFVAYGRGEPDALSIAAQAGLKKQPIILTDKSLVPADTLAWLKTEEVDNAYFIGGSSVISSTIINEINKLSAQNVQNNRISGENRHETNANVIKQFFPETQLQSILMAKSETESLVDALSAGPLAAKLGSPVLLVSSSWGLVSSQKQVVAGKNSKHVHQIGGGVNPTSVNEVVN
ncbi:cell wall-binding repeat-containing protein [Neobacillus niacini]|uniref:cell wall-binding repeat-containing protein n=1 Tax=Neobacillus niacini TaxID=86668 RepID=UPI003983D599